MSDKLIIFDTTLRDGEQSPGASMTKDEKLRIGDALTLFGVGIDANIVSASLKAIVSGLQRALQRGALSFEPRMLA